MLNKIWPVFIIVSFLYAIINGNINELNNSIFESAASSVELCITFLGTICLWNGIIKIMEKTTLIEKLKKIIKPVMKILFPEVKKDSKIYSQISMNIIANILGLGNAATPIGIKAMESMQEKKIKKDTLSNSMIMFIVLNTASLQIIPTTVIAIRASLNSTNPSIVVLPIWIATLFSALTAIIITKILSKKAGERK